MERIIDWMFSHPFMVLLIILIIFVIFIYNNLNGKKHRIEKSFSTIDVYLQKRFDKMKSLLEETVQAYEHESKTYENISRLRTGITKAMEEGTINAKVNAENQMNAFIAATPMIRTEGYPQLDIGREMSIFTAKQTVISEEELAAARSQYNANVTSFNRAITSFPTMLFAKLFGFGEPYELFKVQEAAKERPSFNTVKEEKLDSELKMAEMTQAAEAKRKIQEVADRAALKAAEAAEKELDNNSEDKNE